MEIKGTLKGKRTDLSTGETKEVDLSYEITPSDYFVGQDALQLIEGPTGYESFIIDKNLDNLTRMSRSGWRACVGTTTGYDELTIEAPEMMKVLEAYRTYGNKVCPHCGYKNAIHDVECHHCQKVIEVSEPGGDKNGT